MQNGMWLASVFGPCLMVVGLWMLCYRDNAAKVLASMKATPGVIYLFGLFNLLVGLIFLNTYHMWMPDLSILVTLFGWVALIRGLLVFFMPQLIFKKSMSTSGYLRGKGLVMLVWGFGLAYYAFWM